MALEKGKFFTTTAKAGTNASVIVKSRTYKTNSRFINTDVSLVKMSDLFDAPEAIKDDYCIFGQTHELYRNIQLNNAYQVYYNYITYNCTAKIYNSNILYLGNMHIFDSTTEDTSEPFVYIQTTVYGNDLWLVIPSAVTSSDIEHTAHLEILGAARTITEMSDELIPNGNIKDGTAYKSANVGDTNSNYGAYSFVSGLNSKTTAGAIGATAEGIGVVATSKGQHVHGKNNVLDTENTYVTIVGNGSDAATGRSNAHTVAWDGEAWFQGDVYTGSTSGTQKDSGSKKLATEEYVDSKQSSKKTIDLGTGTLSSTTTTHGISYSWINGLAFPTDITTSIILGYLNAGLIVVIKFTCNSQIVEIPLQVRNSTTAWGNISIPITISTGASNYYTFDLEIKTDGTTDTITVCRITEPHGLQTVTEYSSSTMTIPVGVSNDGKLWTTNQLSSVAAKTSDMTQEVGLDSSTGKLWTAPSGSSGEPAAYLKSASVSGNTLTLTNKDDTTVSFTPEGGGSPSAYIKTAAISTDATKLTLTKQDDTTVDFVSKGYNLRIDGKYEFALGLPYIPISDLTFTLNDVGTTVSSVYEAIVNAYTNKVPFNSTLRLVFALNYYPLIFSCTRISYSDNIVNIYFVNEQFTIEMGIQENTGITFIDILPMASANTVKNEIYNN